MMKIFLFLLLAISLLAPMAPPATASAEEVNTANTLLETIEKNWVGDLDGMIDRRVIRVLVVFGKTTFFIDKGTQRGATHDSFREFEKVLNEELKKKTIKVHVVFIPVSRDDLLPALVEGRGDIAAANLTVTEERQRLVDFTEPLLSNVREILVTGPQAQVFKDAEALAGQKIFVRKSSSYYASLMKLNQHLNEQKKPSIILEEVPENLEDEDLLEMVQAGLIEAIVVDEHKALFWKQIFPQIVLNDTVVLRNGGTIAWAIRKNSPRLKAELDEFIAGHRKGTLFGNILLKRYLQNSSYVKSATEPQELEKFTRLISLFRKYGDAHALDWLLMAAQGYQESRLDQSVRSKAGAIGVMQVLPSTGKEMGVGDITKLEPNIHAGVKYIRFMIDQYYQDEPMDDLNKGLFAFASYNAGPSRIRSLRQEAGRRRLDPNRWFNNVELIAAEKIGRETVTYVSNIYKYYIAYQLVRDQQLKREEAKENLESIDIPPPDR